MNRIPLKSQGILAAGYDPIERTLEVEFDDGSIQRFENVPQTRYDELIRDDSPAMRFTLHTDRPGFVYSIVRPKQKSRQ